MLILVYSQSPDFLSRHEYAITAEGHECACTNSSDEAIEIIRSQPVDIIYMDTASIANGFERLMYELNAFNNNSAFVFACANLEVSGESSSRLGKGIHDIIYTCNDDPRPFIGRLRSLKKYNHGEQADISSSEYNNASLHSYSIDNTSFNWKFTCHADISAIRETDVLERITRATQSFPIPTEHYRNILIVLSELYNNAVDHGLLSLPSELKQGAEGFSRFYELRLDQLSRQSAGSLDVTLTQTINTGITAFAIAIKDSGKGFDYEKLSLAENNETPYGRGYLIVRKLCKSIEYSGCGNQVTAIYEWAI